MASAGLGNLQSGYTISTGELVKKLAPQNKELSFFFRAHAGTSQAISGEKGLNTKNITWLIMTQEFAIGHRNIAAIQHNINFAVVYLLGRDECVGGALNHEAGARKKRYLFSARPLSTSGLGD